MIELFLILREKCFVINDENIASLLHTEWDLYAFLQQLIQALLPRKSFGGYNNNFSKEIMVSVITEIFYYTFNRCSFH